MYSVGWYKGRKYVRTQRSKQLRRILMGTGALTLGLGGYFGYHTWQAQTEQLHHIAYTAQTAERVAANKPAIRTALSQADKVAAEIGNEVADPSTVVTYTQLRNQARTILTVDVPVPGLEDDAAKAVENREIANGMLAANASVVANLTVAEQALRDSHEAYEELVAAKADAAAARAQLEGLIPAADQLLTDTAPSVDGWVYVEEELRIPLSDALNVARNAVLAVEDKALSSVADYNRVAAGCRDAGAKLVEAGNVVSSNIKLPEPVIPLDENGNPIVVEVPVEQPAETPVTG